jgi:hypothetical protein
VPSPARRGGFLLHQAILIVLILFLLCSILGQSYKDNNVKNFSKKMIKKNNDNYLKSFLEAQSQGYLSGVIGGRGYPLSFKRLKIGKIIKSILIIVFGLAIIIFLIINF